MHLPWKKVFIISKERLSQLLADGIQHAIHLAIP